MVDCRVPKILKRANESSVSKTASHDEYNCSKTSTLAPAHTSLLKFKSKGKSKAQSGWNEISVPDDIPNSLPSTLSLSSTLVDDPHSVIGRDNHDTSEQLEIPIQRRSLDYENIAAIARVLHSQEKGMKKHTGPGYSLESDKKVIDTFVENHSLGFSFDSEDRGKRSRNTFLDDPNFLDIVNLKRGISKDGDNYIRKIFDDNLIGWLQSWYRIINNYRPEVWGDLLLTVAAAEQEIRTFTRQHHRVTDSIVVNHLRTVLDSLQNDQTLRKSRLRYICEKNRKVSSSETRVQAHLSFLDFSNGYRH